MDDRKDSACTVPYDPRAAQIVAPPFIAADILQQIDPVRTKEKLARIIETQIVPRLMSWQAEKTHALPHAHDYPTQQEIAKLAALVLDPDRSLAPDYVEELQKQGLSTEGLCVNLLEPAARHLGVMWDRDECDFIEVTLGVARLQQLLSLFNCSFTVPAFSEKRRVCMIAIADEQHSMGIEMVEKFLRACGWAVQSERGTTLRQVAPLVERDWFAVVGLTVSSDRQLDGLASAIQSIRQNSRNPSVGIMVGGPPFNERPELAAEVGADATAANAPTAVVLAQKLFDIGAKTNWQDSYDVFNA